MASRGLKPSRYTTSENALLSTECLA